MTGFEISFASFVVGIVLGIFDVPMAIIFYMAASTSASFDNWWIYTLTALVLLIVTTIIRKVKDAGSPSK